MLAAAGVVVVLWLLAGICYAPSSGIHRMTLYRRAVHESPPPGGVLAGDSAAEGRIRQPPCSYARLSRRFSFDAAFE